MFPCKIDRKTIKKINIHANISHKNICKQDVSQIITAVQKNQLHSANNTIQKMIGYPLPIMEIFGFFYDCCE